MKKKVKKTKVQARNTYTLNDRANAKRYYIIGLTLLEISKLTDIPFKTLERWYISENWKEQRDLPVIKNKANDLHLAGKSYKEIARMLNISIATVYRYIKAVRNAKQTNN